MQAYRAPLRDLRFAMHEVLDLAGHYRRLGLDEVTAETLDAILEQSARFAEDVVAPTNRLGDEIGVRYVDGEVITPPGFKEAYRQYCADGWNSMTGNPAYGGQGLPESACTPVSEMLLSANLAWRLYGGLNESAILALEVHANDELKRTFLPKLIEGSWSGTMCLTEPQAGTDLGLLRTRATPAADASYRLDGTKIFITSGEHDMSENIVHLVLARLPDAPQGSRGISLFVVPKFLPAGDAGIGERNAVRCGSIEQKMGIHGSSTCLMRFEGATGWLVGEPHRGLACMFTMMNHARLGVGMQGLGLAELAFQRSLAYARERLQGRAARVERRSAQRPADPILVHPDVRRMLLTQKAYAEGCRLLALYTAQQLDLLHFASEERRRQEAEELLALLTPIVKGFMTEAGYEACHLAVQIFGGHGYIREAGIEQLLRDARISLIYEGTNGVQAMDLLGRKVLGSNGRLLERFAGIVDAFCAEHAAEPALAEFIEPLAERNGVWRELVAQLARSAVEEPDAPGAAAMDFLMYSGYLVLGWCWARMAVIARSCLDGEEPAFYRSKLATARFYFQRILPRTLALERAILAGAGSLMALEEDEFAFL